MNYGLPKSVTVKGKEYPIRSDFRDVLVLFEILNDPELKDPEKAYLSLRIFYEKLPPPENTDEAILAMYWFINGGKEQDVQESQPALMDWEKDFSIIISPVNKILGKEARAEAYLHWWTFLAAFMEIGECTFAQVIHIRSMQQQGKQLDKQDREWYRRNRELVDIKPKYTKEEEDFFKKWGV